MGTPTGSTSQRSFLGKLFKRSRAEKKDEVGVHGFESPPPYAHDESRSKSSPSSRITNNGSSEAPLSPSSLVTAPSLRLAPDSTGNSHRRSGSRDRRLEPQGLHVVHEPQDRRIADIIFVHGLGGSSISTWSQDQDGLLFWPKTFLRLDPLLSKARILTFGYAAFYWDVNASGSLSITDFARSLLAGLKNEPQLALGKAPIVFVAHSLGGLVVKKAYILGRFNDAFQDIVNSVSAMIFLGTPHHGSDLAKGLNRLLAVSLVGPAPKQYIADLDENSPAIEDLNEQFRHIPSELQIASFYETRYTTFGVKKLLIVDKKCSIIGCRGEIPQPLDADHHNLCKYISASDANYVRVRNTLHSFIGSLAPVAVSDRDTFTEDMEKVSTLLAVPGLPEDDFNFYFDRWMSGTCSWILEKTSPFTEWMLSSMNPQALWISGPPGTGKSVLASFLIDHLRARKMVCAFYFFRSGDQFQRSATACLRSIAFQLAWQHPPYRRRLEEMCEAGARLYKNDAKSLWQKLFVPTIARLRMEFPFYVVIDAIDESDSPQTLLSLLSSAHEFLLLRLIVISRPTHAITTNFSKFTKFFPVTRIYTDSSNPDIPIFVQRELGAMQVSESTKQTIAEQIIERASGNFLWVHLAAKEVLTCHTEDEIEQALLEIPSDMQPLYRRIEQSMVEGLKASDQRLSKALLTWVSCSQRVLTVDELSYALEPSFGHILDLARTISQICGSLLIVDKRSHVTFVHQTAREYLTKFSTGLFAIERGKANEDLFSRCMACLCDQNLRAQIKKDALPSFVSYAASSWHFHLQIVSASSTQVFVALSTFLQDMAVLTWIQILSSLRQLRLLVQSSQSLANFADRKRICDASIAPNLRPLEALEAVDLWATDLVKVVGKFGRNLLEMPESIHRFIPQFCPRSSAINAQFGRKSAFSVVVPGDANTVWDDNLARIFTGADSEAVFIVCAGRFFAVLTSTNSIIVWDGETCQEMHRLQHPGRVMKFCLSYDGKMIASYGSRYTKIWDSVSGREVLSVPSPSERRVLSLVFARQNSVLMISSEDRHIRTLQLSGPEALWQDVDLSSVENQMTSINAASSSPCSTALSPDGRQVVMAFRGAPLSLWSIEDLQLVARCRRERSNHTSYDTQPWTPVDKVIWRSLFTEVIGIYMGGALFKWNPLEEDSSHEVDAAASTIACSVDGDLVASSDANGTVKIWKFSDFVLVYQLRYDYPVTDLAFAPDNRRFYDLRASFCNVWEPNALIRLSDLDKSGSEAASDFASIAMSMTPSDAEVSIKEPITALAIGPIGHMYVAGNADGIVTLTRNTGQAQTELWASGTFMPIEQIAFAADGKHIALRDLGGKVVVKPIDLETSSTLSSKPIFDVTAVSDGGPVQQLILSPSAEYILIVRVITAQLFSVAEGLLNKEWISDNQKVAPRWINHPLHADMLLAIGSERAWAYNWHDLSLAYTICVSTKGSETDAKSSEARLQQIRRPSDPSLIHNETGVLIEKAMLTQDKKYIILEFTNFGDRASSLQCGSRQLRIYSVADFEKPVAESAEPIQPIQLPSHLLGMQQLPLGVLSGDRFVFLDNDHWLCSWQLGPRAREQASALKRYFFLPRDWLNAECLDLCQVLDNGVFLIPRQGEVAAIRSDLGVQW